MPLLHKKSFALEPIPEDLGPDEEVFLCKPTKEVFRDYEKFFNRMFQCNSQVWTCEMTGTSGLTYQQALESEAEASKLISSLDESLQRAVLTLVHHARRTNIKTLADEIAAFYRERFVKGEVVDVTNTTTSGAKILNQVRVLQVIPPLPVVSPRSPTGDLKLGNGDDASGSPPIRVSVITTPKPLTNHTASPSSDPHTSPLSASTSSTPSQSENPLQGLSNGLPHSTSKSTGKPPKTKTPSTPKSPISPEMGLDPSQYKYVVEHAAQSGEPSFTVKATLLSRVKGVLAPKKLKIFLRNATYRVSEKHPFAVKEEYVKKFSLGASSVLFATAHSPIRSSARKRSLSQSRLDTFFSPGATPGSFSLSDSFIALPSAKKKQRLSTSASKPKSKKPSAAKRRLSKTSGKKKDRKSSIKTGKSPMSPAARTPNSKIPKSLSSHSSLKSPMNKMEAQKVLNKAKKFKQMDLKNSVMSKKNMTPMELAERKMKAEFERQYRMKQQAEEKERRKELRLKRLRENKEKRKQEKMRQRELLKPREDLMCDDSKPLPQPVPVQSSIPPELFGDAVMVLEFLNNFGPLFDIKEVIRGGITFEDIEYAITTQEMDSLLYEIIKFLLQAIFATMEEEHESVMVNPKPKKSRVSTPELSDAAGAKAGAQAEEKENKFTLTAENVNGLQASPCPEDEESKKDGVSKEGTPAVGVPMTADDEMEERKPLNEQLETIKEAARGYSQWSFITQHLSLHELVIDAYTVTEVLRLHFLSCGGFKDSGDRSWFRHARRGGFTDSDDPSMSLKLLQPELISALVSTPIYALPPVDKLEVLSTLCSQLLTYSVAREYIDESMGKVKKARRLVREIQAEEKRKKEEKVKAKAKLKQQQEGGGAGQQAPKTGKTEEGAGGSKKTSPAPASVTVAAGESGCKDQPIQLDPATETKEDSNKKVTEGKKQPDPSKNADAEALDKEDEEEERERLRKMNEEVLEHQEVIREASACVNIQPVGLDRYHRRYLLFPSMPGLFVEDTGQYPGMGSESTGAVIPPSEPSEALVKSVAPPTLLPSPSKPSVVGATPPTQLTLSAKPHGSLMEGATPPAQLSKPLVVGTTTPTQLSPAAGEKTESTMSAPAEAKTARSESPVPQAQSTWSCYSSQEDIEKLMSSLNPRGIREGELKKKLDQLKDHLTKSATKCVFTGERSVPSAQPRHSSAAEFFELYLREQILDIEEKIHIGNLGYVRDRVHWRESIENSGAAAAIPSKSTTPSRSASPATPTSQQEAGGAGLAAPTTKTTSSTVRELANALLQVQAGIGKKFLMPPLGTSIDHKKRRLRNRKQEEVKESDVCLEQWRLSLGKAASFSQVFLHLATLERAVMWSKSLMNVRCRICRRKCGDEFMLLCDGCDHGYHTYCLKPPLKHVPEGDWFCYDCMPITPVKPRRRVQRVVIVEEEEEEEEAESSESEAEGAESDDEEEEEEEPMEEDKEEEYQDEEAPQRNLRSARSQRGGAGGNKKAARGGKRGRGGRGGKAQRGRGGGGRGRKRKSPEPVQEPPPAKRGRGRGKGVSERKRSSQDSNVSDVGVGVAEGPRAKKRLKMDASSDASSAYGDSSRAESVIASIIDLRCSHGNRKTGAAKRELKGMEMQLCEVLWEELSQHPDSYHFAIPVKKRECPDYFDIISDPMDLQTVKCRIKSSKYSSIDDFLTDIFLIFSNAVEYNKANSKVGKAVRSLKQYFEKRCNNLGLKDLNLTRLDSVGKQPAGRRRSGRLH